MIKAELDKDFVERALRFANLREDEITTAEVVQGIWRSHPYVRERAVLWSEIQDQSDVADFKALHRTVRGWLRTLTVGQWEDIKNDRIEVLARYKEKSTLPAIVEFTTLDGKPGRLSLPIWGLPNAQFDEKNQLTFEVMPLITGVESAVYFAMILLYVASDGGRQSHVVSVCQAPLPKAERGGLRQKCEKFFLRSHDRWVVCSDACKKERRRAKVYEAVSRYYADQRKKREEGGREKQAKKTTRAKTKKRRGK